MSTSSANTPVLPTTDAPPTLVHPLPMEMETDDPPAPAPTTPTPPPLPPVPATPTLTPTTPDTHMREAPSMESATRKTAFLNAARAALDENAHLRREFRKKKIDRRRAEGKRVFAYVTEQERAEQKREREEKKAEERRVREEKRAERRRLWKERKGLRDLLKMQKALEGFELTDDMDES